MADIPIADQIACVEREVRMRHGAYPRWVKGGRMTQAKADGEIRAMEAVLQTLRGLAPAPAEPEQRSFL